MVVISAPAIIHDEADDITRRDIEIIHVRLDARLVVICHVLWTPDRDAVLGDACTDAISTRYIGLKNAPTDAHCSRERSRPHTCDFTRLAGIRVLIELRDQRALL